jgi:hypothetical protein
MIDFIHAALFVLVLGQFLAFCWLAHISGRITGLTGEVRRKPGLLRRLREVADKQSELHLPNDFEKAYRDDDRTS